MTLSPTLALVWTLTTLAAALMILAATSTSTVVQRRPRRCPACGRLASQGRCRCTDL
jgi:hypothetical protein